MSIQARSLILLLSTLGLQGQSFVDSPAMGGSQVFSEGFNPLSSPANFSKPCEMSSSDSIAFLGSKGDLYHPDAKAPLDDLSAFSALSNLGVSEALVKLKDAPWGLREKAFGFSLLSRDGLLFLGREERSAYLARVDSDPTHLGSASNLAQNQTKIMGRYAQIDRFVLGPSKEDYQKRYGLALRVERVSLGRREYAFQEAFGTNKLPNQDGQLNFNEKGKAILTATLDMGMTYPIFQGVVVGIHVNRLTTKRFEDVTEKSQVRAGLAVDIGSLAVLRIESDLNKAQRLPLPVDQKGMAASLFIKANPTVTLSLGVEQREIDSVKTTAAGAQAWVNLQGFQMGFGLRISKDKPLSAAMMRF